MTNLIKLMKPIGEGEPDILGTVLRGDPPVSIGEVDLLSAGRGCREGHVHRGECLRVSLHVPDAAEPRDVVPIHLMA